MSRENGEQNEKGQNRVRPQFYLRIIIPEFQYFARIIFRKILHGWAVARLSGLSLSASQNGLPYGGARQREKRRPFEAQGEPFEAQGKQFAALERGRGSRIATCF